MDNVTFTMKLGYPGEVYQLHQSSDPDLYYVTPLGVVPEGIIGDGTLHSVRTHEIEEAFKSGMWIKK